MTIKLPNAGKEMFKTLLDLVNDAGEKGLKWMEVRSNFTTKPKENKSRKLYFEEEISGKYLIKEGKPLHLMLTDKGREWLENPTITPDFEEKDVKPIKSSAKTKPAKQDKIIERLDIIESKIDFVLKLLEKQNTSQTDTKVEDKLTILVSDNKEPENLNQAIERMYENLKTTFEFRSGNVAIPTMYKRIKDKWMPKLTLEDFHTALQKLSDEKQIWLNFINNPDLVENVEQSIKKDGRYYYYILWR